jgi:endonuclease/exonuclease/phosphatase family metal-dependent hydrolase
MKFLQWNVMYSEDIRRVIGLLRDIDADVICLQELTMGYDPAHLDTGEYVADDLGYQGFWKYGPMVLPDGQETQMGVGIFSRYQLADSRHLVLQPGAVRAGKIVQDERIYLQARVILPSSSVVVGTTHLPFHPQFHTTPAKSRMIGRILEYADDAGARYMLSGDMNATPSSRSMREIRQRLRHAGPSLGQKTWTTKPFSIGGRQYSGIDWRLDYVLHGGGLRVQGTQIIDTDISDHLPVLVTFV